MTKVDKKEIRKYGNSSESSSFGANAYLLFYRNINTLDELKNKVQIPEELNEKIMKDPIVEDKFDNEVKMDRLSTINRGLVLKIYTEYNKHETIVVRDRG